MIKISDDFCIEISKYNKKYLKHINCENSSQYAVVNESGYVVSVEWLQTFHNSKASLVMHCLGCRKKIDLSIIKLVKFIYG